MNPASDSSSVTPPAMPAAIEVRGLAKSYGRTTALADLSFTVGRGEIVGFLGPNGAGKTTAVRLLVGLSRPSGGTGTVLGAPLGAREARRRIGYLPELFRYQSWLSPAEVLALHARLIGMATTARPAAIARALETVGLADRGDDRVGILSKGMQQRLGLAVALLGDPELLILDEPTSALDPVGRRDVREVLVAARAAGATILLDSHLLTEVERICDRVVILDRGRVVAAGTLDELTRPGGVRIRADGAELGALDRFGGAVLEDGWIRVAVEPDRIPDVVSLLAATGARIHAVEPVRGTLEDRFLALVGHGPAT
jgi:ABC-2 type transport system ATP-binding protein